MWFCFSDAAAIVGGPMVGAEETDMSLSVQALEKEGSLVEVHPLASSPALTASTDGSQNSLRGSKTGPANQFSKTSQSKLSHDSSRQSFVKPTDSDLQSTIVVGSVQLNRGK